MHFCHIFAANSLDDVAFVVRRMKTGAAAALSVTVQRSAACQRVLQTERKTKTTEKQKPSKVLSWYNERCEISTVVTLQFDEDTARPNFSMDSYL